MTEKKIIAVDKAVAPIVEKLFEWYASASARAAPVGDLDLRSSKGFFAPGRHYGISEDYNLLVVSTSSFHQGRLRHARSQSGRNLR
jgi:hypothetical protein